jgi:WhiB family transcriptional regulator, redox-sensing transcriptional regulator
MVNVITAAMGLVETSAGVLYPTADPFGEAIVALAEEDGDEQDWQERALCAQTDPEAFFPEKGGSTREAKRICSGCEVRAECLEYALAHDERFGIWGGLSERERRRLRRAVS